MFFYNINKMYVFLSGVRYLYFKGFLLCNYKSSCFENEKHQTRVSLLLELVSDAYLTAIESRTFVFHAGYYTTRPKDPDDG